MFTFRQRWWPLQIPTTYKCSALLPFMQRVDFCHIISHLVSAEAASLGLFALATFYISTKFSYYVRLHPCLKKSSCTQTPAERPNSSLLYKEQMGFPNFLVWKNTCRAFLPPCQTNIWQKCCIFTGLSQIFLIFVFSPTNPQWNSANRKST